MNERILKRFLNAEVIGLCLIVLAIQVLLYGVETAIRGTQLSDLFWICLLGTAISFSASKSNWNGRGASVVVVALGLIGVWILGARIANPLVDLIWSFIKVGPQILPQVHYRFDIDASGFRSAWNTISLASSALTARWQAWLLGLTGNVQVNDVLIRNMLWTLVLWLISAWTGWFAAKRNGTASLLPGAVLLTLLLWPHERRAESLWAFVMIMLLLMGIWNYRNHAQHWDTNRIDYSDSIRSDMSQYILMVVVVAGIISYVTPSISWRDIRDYFREREQPQQNEVVAQPAGNSNTTPQTGQPRSWSSLPREHLLTAGYAQSKDIVMTIRTGELSPVPMQSLAANAPRYYWRAIIYDQYDSRGWFTTAAPSQSVPANQPIIAGVLSGYKLLHLNVQMQQPEGKLYWSGLLYSASIPLTVDWRLRPQSSLFADQTDLLQADMFAARTDATSYQADAVVPTASMQQLRAAPAEDYPQHIRHLYFSLPKTVPERVHSLARQITEGQTTAYDKAKAIEAYLRAEYPYNLEISAPPEDQDVADYFLFDLKQGYCDYYATAMVVLARSSGLPARFVSGYASGEYDALNAQYVVRELHAHSWAEIYFPQIGWVEFEPTGNQPEIERVETDLGIDAKDDLESPSQNIFVELTNWKSGALLIPLTIFLAGVVIYYTFIEVLFFYRIAPTAAVEILYRRLYHAGRPLAGEHARAETAYEFMNKLIQHIQLVNESLKRSTNVLQKDIRDLTLMYQASLFGHQQINHQDVQHALKIWRRLRWSLMMERAKHFFWMRNKTSP